MARVVYNEQVTWSCSFLKFNQTLVKEVFRVVAAGGAAGNRPSLRYVVVAIWAGRAEYVGKLPYLFIYLEVVVFPLQEENFDIVIGSHGFGEALLNDGRLSNQAPRSW